MGGRIGREKEKGTVNKGMANRDHIFTGAKRACLYMSYQHI